MLWKSEWQEERGHDAGMQERFFRSQQLCISARSVRPEAVRVYSGLK